MMGMPLRYRNPRSHIAWNPPSPMWVLGGLRTRAFASNQESNRAETLKGREDRYNGFIVDPDKLPEEPSAFSRQLDQSLKVGHLLQSSRIMTEASYYAPVKEGCA